MAREIPISEFNNGYDPTSDKECKDVIGELDELPKAERWGLLNSFACDCYHAGEADIMANGPTHTASNRRFTKEEALAWIEKIYG